MYNDDKMSTPSSPVLGCKAKTFPQHGFTEGKSCLTNLITFYDEVTGLADEGRAVDIVSLDFSKAFGTVSRNTFVEKLMMCGLDEQTVKWTENCLNCQAQRGMISGTKSSV
ncbi:hypothetical protein QYF61_018729 [Mycteria americana]|uniref:Reverse transcriptase domain-containing protein n=1 Tax=Mycteria americana TaxID=33587 RepID=A0AAN7N2M8_MYCAM|nr:hypothetical protein QYF61_018729 [Mycteria americana]